MRQWKAVVAGGAESNGVLAELLGHGGSVQWANRHYRVVQPGGTKMEQAEQKEVFSGPWTLPIVRVDATMYFAYLRLRQFRDISNPHNYIDFDSERGRRMCRQNGIIICPGCETAAIVSPALDMEKLRCVQCFNLIVPLFDI